MEVWVCFPSANPEKTKRTAQAWKDLGYKVAVYAQDPQFGFQIKAVDWCLFGIEYHGYWWACDRIVRELCHVVIGKENYMPYERSIKFVTVNPDAFVLASDDIDPDPKLTAEDICKQYLSKFPDGYGIMQPCGDLQGEAIEGKHNAARICGSPWFGKGWVKSGFGGRYVAPTEYFHFYGDEVLKEVSEKLGLLWMRDDLTQDHKHWAFGRDRRCDYQERNSKLYWDRDKARFMRHKAEGFKEYLGMFMERL